MPMGHREAQQALDYHGYPSGKKFLLYRVATIVNPHHDFEYWQTPSVAAEETELAEGTVRKYMREFAEDGWLVVLERGGGRGNPTRYRWNAETATGVAVSETAPGVRETATGISQTAPGVQKGLSIETKETKEEKRRESDAMVLALELCVDLEEYIAAEAGREQKTVPKSWVDDMDKIMRLDGKSADQVRSAMRWVFMTEAGSFWRSNILSPKKLRMKWDTLSIQARQAGKGGSKGERDAATTQGVVAAFENWTEQPRALPLGDVDD